MPKEIDKNSREYFDKRKGALDRERESFISHYKDLSKNIQPRRGRFFVEDNNQGGKKHQEIINSAATQAHRIARAGLFAGVMSPARPWFALGTPDPGLKEFQPVKEWLADVELRMRLVFNASNLYNMAPTYLGELLLFGTGAMTQVDDFNDVARFYTHTAGSYWIAQNSKFQVTTLVREYMMTVEQMVGQFGLERVSEQVKRDYDKGDYMIERPVTQFIEPNPNFNRTKQRQSKFKRFRSVRYESGEDKLKPKFLSQSGFDDFPGYVARWDVTGEDVYGTDCPGMLSLGDVKGLQIEEKRKAQAIDKMVNPPLRGPASLRNVPVSSLPGGLTVYDSLGPNDQLSPIYMVTPQIQELKEDIQNTERRINEAFYVDMFLAISQMEGIQPRNELELIRRNEERLLQLGPVLERVHGEFLDRLIDRTFIQMVNAELIPPAPEELQGQPLKVEFISSLAMAQKAVATGSIDRLAAFVTGLSGAGYGNVLDKFDADQAVDEYASLIGVPPKLVVADDVVAEIREARAQQERNLQAMQLAEQGARVARDASQATFEGDNVLSRVAEAGNQNEAA